MGDKANEDLTKYRYFYPEASYGAGANAAKQQDIEVVSDGLEFTSDNRKSQNVDGTGQTTEQKRINIGVAGPLAFELAYERCDDFILMAQRSSGWSSAVKVTDVVFSIDDGDNSINDAGGSYLHTASLAITTNNTITRDGGSWLTDGFRNGMIITAANSEDAGNDGDHIITGISALAITIGAAGLTDNGADTTMDISNAGGFITDGYLANQLVRTSGFTTAGNNGMGKIVSVVAAKMVIAGPTFVTEIAGDSVTINMGPQAVNGIAVNTFGWEREYDVASEFSEVIGGIVNGMEIGSDANDIVTATFNILAKDDDSDTTTAGDGSPTAAVTNSAFSTQEDMQAIYENNTSYEASTVSIVSLGNAKVRDNILALLGAQSAAVGMFDLSGTIEALYETKTVYDKVTGFTSSSIIIAMENTDGAMAFEVVEIKYGSGKRTGGGVNSDIVMTTPFEGNKDATELITLRVVKFDIS